MPAYIVDPTRPDWPQDHLRRYLATNGEDGYYVDFRRDGGPELTPTLLLTTTGRRSGKLRIVPLTFGRSDKSYVIVASNGGAPQHPAWYLNLSANPEVQLQIEGKRFHARARVAAGEERWRLWKLMAEIYPPYDQHRKLTAREIPLVVLEPLPS
jgi:deazaflavin-dependent oxidoreductase (nitroreductase family)